MTVNIHTRTPEQKMISPGFKLWQDAGKPAAVVTDVRVGGFDQVMLTWTVDGEDIASDCFARRGTDLSRADFDFFFRLGAQANIAPKQGWIML